MKNNNLLKKFILFAILLIACSCNNSSNKIKEDRVGQATATDSATGTNSSTTTQHNNNTDSTAVNNVDTSLTQQSNNADSMFLK